VGKPGKKKWLEGLEPPGLMRRLEIMRDFIPEKLGVEGVKRTVRAMNPRPNGRHPCFVCGGHRYISQAHHLIEVATVAKFLNWMAIYDWSPSIPVVSLCPNHHAYLHAMRRYKNFNDVPPDLTETLGEELSARDWDRLVEIDEQRAEAHDRVLREVREEFLRREDEYRRSKPEMA
jgi:hypothetical protein